MAMTRGYKMDIFLLGLSFIGWDLLGILCLFIGTLFVHPYREASFAEMYVFLRGRALRERLCTPEELGFVKDGAE
jgi:uncharacterized membrane protein